MAIEQMAKALVPPPAGSMLMYTVFVSSNDTGGRSTKAATCGSLNARDVVSADIPMLSRSNKAGSSARRACGSGTGACNGVLNV